jgi:hypothetical protein
MHKTLLAVAELLEEISLQEDVTIYEEWYIYNGT